MWRRLAGRSSAGDYDFEEQSNSLAIVRRHHFGLTLAGAVAGRLRYGATVGALFDKDLSFTHYSAHAGFNPPGPASEIVTDVEATSRVLGLELAFGMQAELTKRVHVAGFVRRWCSIAGAARSTSCRCTSARG